MTPAVGSKNLGELLIKEIKDGGPMDFARFMELALYHPEFGYYSRHEQTGDYYTNADVHPIFASLLAQYIRKQCKNQFPNQNVHLIELGAGAGVLAKNLLDACRHFPEFYGRVHYIGIEASPVRRRAAERNLSGHAQAQMRADFDFPNGSIQGVIFSNEFFDALPVRRVIRQNGKIREIFINEDLKETVLEASAEVRNYFEWLGTGPKENCTAEAHLAAREWMEKMAQPLKSGIVLSIDYGMHAEQIYSEQRPEGTLLCHFRHRTNRDFYSRPGEQDITAHVNFTALIKEGEARGLRLCSLQTQSEFLIETGIEEMQQAVHQEKDPRRKLKASSAIKSLIHPEGMGGTFKVLIQKKEIDLPGIG